MKVISFDVARVTVLFPVEEVIPLGGVVALDVINDVMARYKFAKVLTWVFRGRSYRKMA